MAQRTEPADTSPERPALAIPEREPDPGNPWSDDMLDRRAIGERLTRIVRAQKAPFVISVDGRWGTGKTFVLKRWAQELRTSDPGWRAIYYNAWEDDFASDPLLAIIAQVREHLGEGFAERVRRVVAAAGPLLYQAVSAASLLGGGMSLPPLPAEGDGPASERLDAYDAKRAATEELRETLRSLASDVREETGHPLVFIIDELDRCRPTFAIALLERVKHIFDVPDVVFVFGVNRLELTRSVQSVYGAIEAGTYLRRFFDLEFVLPDADPMRFCLYLLHRYGLDDFFSELSTRARGRRHLPEFQTISEYLPVVVGDLGLSLRDMDYCVRLLALAAGDLDEGETLHPALFVVLVAIKIDDPQLYRRFVDGTARGAELIDHLNERRRRTRAGSGLYRTREERRILDAVEAAVYCADDAGITQTQLELRLRGAGPTLPDYLSSETAALDRDVSTDRERLSHLEALVRGHAADPARYGVGRRYLAGTIDLYSGPGGR